MDRLCLYDLLLEENGLISLRNGVTLFTTTNVTVWLEPGESATVTYSSTPSMFKDRK